MEKNYQELYLKALEKLEKVQEKDNVKLEKLKEKNEKLKKENAELKEKNKKLRSKVKDLKDTMDPEAAERAAKKAAKKADAKKIKNVYVDDEKLDFKELADSIDEKTKETVIRLKASEITKDTFRFVVDRFYDAQKKRIILSNQIDSIARGKDVQDDTSLEILKMEYAVYVKLEAEYNKLMDVCTKRTRSGRWLREVSGVGPALAATFEAYLDVRKGKHASSFQSYAGLNDHSKPWYSKEQAKTFVKNAMTEYDTTTITDDVIIKVAADTGWSVQFLQDHCMDKELFEKTGEVFYSKTDLEKSITILPFNRNLKTACWKLGDTFVKNANRKSMYGKIYQQRKAYELEKNEKGEYAEFAAQCLQKKNYTGDTRKTYESGKLPLNHIEQRARRYAVKMFISHYFEACYRYTYGKPAERPYPIEHLGHTDYIGPEVPYDSVQ